MKSLDRRRFLKTAAAAGAAATVAQRAEAKEFDPRQFDHAQSMLYDATRCIGCRTCVRACREANNLPPEERELEGVTFDQPVELSATNWTVIQVYKEDPEEAAAEGREPRWSFLKRNCMHCNVPACASVCPVAALHKKETGEVAYEEDRCIGCRYCMLACPYRVPRYEWLNNAPRVRKCNWCMSCVKACPVGALKQGTRKELIAEAHRRIQAEPNRYVNHVYGELEAGGCSYLILSGVEPTKLDLPDLPPTVRSTVADSIMEALPGWIVGLGLVLGAVYKLTHLDKAVEEAGGEAESAGEAETSAGPVNSTEEAK